MANKELKNRVVLGSAIDRKLADQLRELSKETGINISKLLDKGITLVLNEYKKEVSE